MPAKNSRKSYLANSYYHIYNRGVEKREIFLDEQDSGVFLSYLKTYLLPKDEEGLKHILLDPNSTYRQKEETLKLLRLNNFSGDVTLHVYCLMPNHFHLLVKQVNPGSIDKFMNSLATRYTMYFNKKYKRVGPLYQGVYKAVLINTDEQLLYLSSYIHRNPLASKGQAFRSLPSSYPEYLGFRQSEWVTPSEILSYFAQTNRELSYQAFVERTGDFSHVQSVLLDQ